MLILRGNRNGVTVKERTNRIQQISLAAVWKMIWSRERLEKRRSLT